MGWVDLYGFIREGHARPFEHFRTVPCALSLSEGEELRLHVPRGVRVREARAQSTCTRRRYTFRTLGRENRLLFSASAANKMSPDPLVASFESATAVRTHPSRPRLRRALSHDASALHRRHVKCALRAEPVMQLGGMHLRLRHRQPQRPSGCGARVLLRASERRAQRVQQQAASVGHVGAAPRGSPRLQRARQRRAA